MQDDSQALEQHGHWLNAAKPYIPHWAEGYVDPVVLTVWIVIAGLVLLAYFGGRQLRQVPEPLQNIWEFFVETIQGFCQQIIGPGGERFAPFIGTIFLYVFCNAAIGLVPGFVAPASTLNTTLAPALIVFFAVQYFGFREHGIRYLKHFTGDIWWLAPLMAVLHLIGEIARPMTLSLRLFANVFGDDTLVLKFIDLGGDVLHAIWLPIPLHFPFLFLALFIAFIQGLIFIMLTSAYIALAVGHDEDDDEVSSVETQSCTMSSTESS